jgi:mannan endo-1,4-beta-mannosidase
MNGDWFWWGKKTGASGYKKLYQMLFERLANFHGLNNLLWVFNANEVRGNVDPYELYFPGADKVDILATDVYRGGFARKDYEGLQALAGGKPIALGEVGRLPPPDILHDQPRWTWFMLWGDPSSLWAEREAIKAVYESEEILTRDKLPWVRNPKPRIHYPVMK